MLTATAPAPQALTLLPELADEIRLTRRVFERAPEAAFGWQPHPKSMTLGHLAAHVSNLLDGITLALQTTELDLVKRQAGFVPATEATALLALFDARAAEAQAALADTDDEALAEAWTLRRGEHVVMSRPRAAMVRHLISHMAHHRGQLSVYLRLLDVPVPAIYGPSADESL